MADNSGVERNTYEARNLLAPGNPISQLVEIRDLGTDRFREQFKGEVVDVKKIGEVVAILEKQSDKYELAVFNKQATPIRVPLDPTVVEILASSRGDYIDVSSKPDVSTEKLQNILGRMGFHLRDFNPVVETWSELFFNCRSIGFPDLYVRSRVLNRGANISIPMGDWNLEVMEDQNKQATFVLGVGGSYFEMYPNGPFKKLPLSGEEFAKLEELDKDLPGDLQIVKGYNLFHITNNTGLQQGYSGLSPTQDPSNPGILYFINSGQVYSLDTKGVLDRTTYPVSESQIKIQDPQELAIDPNGNFLIIRSSDNKLSIVDKETGDIAEVVEDVKGFLTVDKLGGIVYLDTQDKLREVQANFQTIPPGGSKLLLEKKEAQLREQQERFANLELGKVTGKSRAAISEVDVANTLRETISRQVLEPINSATNPVVLEDILDRLQGLKVDPANQAYQEVIDEFITQARGKLSGIRTAEFSTQLDSYKLALDEVKSVGDTIGLDEQFARILELRQKLDVVDPQQRREVEQRLRTLQTRKDTLNNQYQGELIAAVNEAIPQIEQLIEETGSPQELAYFSTSVQAQQFEMMLANIRDPQVRKELRDKYSAMRTKQRGKLEEGNRQLEEQDRQRWAQVVDEAREDLASLREQIEQLSDSGEVDRFGRNPLVTAWRAKLFALPPELREIEEKRLEIILGARKKDMEHRKELGAVGETGELKFGNATFPIFKEPPRIWQPKLLPRPGGFAQWADLIFEDSQGKIWRPAKDHDLIVSTDLNDERTRILIEQYHKQADEYFRGIKRRVPEFDEHWRITDYNMEKLEEVVEALNLQLANHRGILIMQGEAGTGKNVLVDMLANLSDREVITVACNENSTKEDLTYDFDYDPKTGTVRWPSRLLEGLQTPGTIILFDEINALKPGISKMLNSLFDYRRRLLFTSGGTAKEIITDPTVLFLGTMNPQNYGGVNRLSPEVKSRARVVDIDYPPFEVARNGRTYYRSDEAEMLAAYMDGLSDFKQPEVRQIWHYLINRDTTNGADRMLSGNPQIETDVRRVYDVIRVANRLREMYTAYQVGDSNEPMDFPTSLREVTDIVMEMNHRQGVKPMIKRVIVPKIDDRRQKKLVEQTIDAVLPA